MEEFKSMLAKVKISENEIEISGPADFVERQFEKQSDIFRAFIELIKERRASQQTNLALPTNGMANNNQHMLIRGESEYADFEDIDSAKSFFEKYSNVVAVSNDKVQFLASIPGNKLAQRMVNLTLLYLYVKLQKKQESVSFNDIRDVCEMHGELDGAHFAHALKQHKRLILIEGNNRSFSAKLTVPGIKEAEQLLNNLK